ncbi:MAG: hypothetical protein J5J00_06785, partial [Deltaproteobacteria bacterium]|nr:hypothetical protein [Deltaproteobacteria bacterium]
MKIKITWLIAVCAALGFWFSEVSAQSVRVSRYQERAEYAISRADYKGRLAGDTLIFNAQLTVELFSDRATKIIFFPSKVTLREVRLDGKPAAIFHNGSAFELSAQGKGSHKISVEFESPVSGGQDRPAVQLSTPSIPVSRFEITLPGKKKLVVSPAAEIKHSEHGADTKAEFFSPINGSFSISWSDVLPSTRAEARVDAEVAQALSTEDGIVSISTLVESEISRGAVGGVKIRVPSLVNVIEVASPQKIVADWRVLKGSEESNILEVIFPRPIENSFNIEILSDFALKKEDNHFKVPVFEVEGAYRQRGMVALVQSKNAMLNPVQEEGATRATDNLLPNWIRSRIDGQVTRTYKYVAGIPALRVQPVAPELPPARFNAESISLLSIGDLSLQGQFITDVVVKAGALNGLNIKTPAAINIISVSAPSLAGHKVDPLQEGQLIRLDFTQRIEGQFRVEVKYEQLLDENKAAVSFPMFEVEKAELQQGYLAVEALSAVEISASGEENFTSLEPKELPQQLVQRSSNPILLAYKYLRTTPL